MATQGISLDSAPPLPPNLRPAPTANAAQLAGPPPAPAEGGAPGGGVQGAVVERLMLAEKALRSAATILPELTPVIDDVVSRLRAGAGRIVLGQAPPAPPNPVAQLMGAMGAGAPAPQPTR